MLRLPWVKLGMICSVFNVIKSHNSLLNIDFQCKTKIFANFREENLIPNSRYFKI